MRNLGRFVSNEKCSDHFLRLTVGPGYSLVLAHMLQPRLDQKRFDVSSRICRISEQSPAHGAIPKPLLP
jgi:hypothetical protein